MEFTDFYDILRDNINSYRGEYERIVDYAPDLFRLLSDLLQSKEIRKRGPTNDLRSYGLPCGPL